MVAKVNAFIINNDNKCDHAELKKVKNAVFLIRMPTFVVQLWILTH